MAHRDIVLLAGYLVRCPLGGYAWQVLHYLAGLRALGFDAYFYEDSDFYCGSYDPVSGNENMGFENGIAFASDFFSRFGLDDAWMFWDAQSDRCYGTRAQSRRDLLASARFTITLAPVTRLPRQAGQRKLFIDIDPGFTQIRAAQGDRSIGELLAEHDLHFTFGENIGRPGCTVPTAGVEWHATRQPIGLDFWQPRPIDSAAAFTTIGRWDENRRDLDFGGDTFAWRKRVEWMKFLDLPQRTGQRFDVALDTDSVPGDSHLLRAHGWEIRDPIAISRDALRYRDFVRASKGEFTVAKDLNIRLRTGWFSDRAACYLAAGRPVVTQDTGFDTVLPTGNGLFAVHDAAQAAAAIERITGDETGQNAAAREIACQYFEAGAVLSRLVERV